MGEFAPPTVDCGGLMPNWVMPEYEHTEHNVGFFLTRVFKCKRCNPSCCQKLAEGDGIVVHPHEIDRMAIELHLTSRQFKRRYTFTKSGASTRFMDSPCPLYSHEEGGCPVHRIRPIVCRMFPFNRPIEISGKMIMTVNVDCPAGREIGEKYGINPDNVLKGNPVKVG